MGSDGLWVNSPVPLLGQGSAAQPPKSFLFMAFVLQGLGKLAGNFHSWVQILRDTADKM